MPRQNQQSQTPRSGQLISSIESQTPKLFKGFFYPVITGIFRIIASLIQNIFWLFVALISFLVGGLHKILENIKNMNQNSPE